MIAIDLHFFTVYNCLFRKSIDRGWSSSSSLIENTNTQKSKHAVKIRNPIVRVRSFSTNLIPPLGHKTTRKRAMAIIIKYSHWWRSVARKTTATFSNRSTNIEKTNLNKCYQHGNCFITRLHILLLNTNTIFHLKKKKQKIETNIQ